MKNKGNTALKAGKIQEAISHYTEAIELDPENHVFYSNRSAAYIQAKKFHEALDDAEKAIELKPDFAKVIEYCFFFFFFFFIEIFFITFVIWLKHISSVVNGKIFLPYVIPSVLTEHFLIFHCLDFSH